MRRVSEAWLLNSGFENILGDSLMLMPSLAQTVGRPRMISAEGPRSPESKSADSEFSAFGTTHGVPLEILTLIPTIPGRLKYLLSKCQWPS